MNLAAFCRGAIEGDAAFNAGPALDDEGNPIPEGLEQLSGQLEPLLVDLEENAPHEIEAEVEMKVDGVTAALNGDESGVESPEFFRAEAAIIRINDDVDLSVSELVQLPEDEAEAMAEFEVR